MITISIHQEGLDIIEISGKFEEKIAQKFIEALADYAEQAMREAAPYRTGRLTNSIQKHTGSLEAKVGPTAEYAPFLEFGTKPHEIKPILSRALKFEANGKIVFAARVRHPGVKPHPFIQAAAQETIEAAPAIWEKIWREEAGE